jgi:two-component system, OmpR family, response regulator
MTTVLLAIHYEAATAVLAAMPEETLALCVPPAQLLSAAANLDPTAIVLDADVQLIGTLRRSFPQSWIAALMSDETRTTADVCAALNTGADTVFAYATSPAIIAAWCHTKVRRVVASERYLSYGPLTVDRFRMAVTVDEVPVRGLTRSEIKILCALIRQPERPVTVDELIVAVCGDAAGRADGTIYNYVCNIRKRLAALSASVVISHQRDRPTDALCYTLVATIDDKAREAAA